MTDDTFGDESDAPKRLKRARTRDTRRQRTSTSSSKPSPSRSRDRKNVTYDDRSSKAKTRYERRKIRRRHRSNTSSKDRKCRHHLSHEKRKKKHNKAGNQPPTTDEARDSNVSVNKGEPFTPDHNSKLRGIKPEKFDGTTCVETFLVKFDSCSRYNGWSSPDKAAYLKASLTGPVGLLLWESEDATYEQLTEKLRRRYGSREQQEKFRVELHCRKRQQNESLQELAQDIERLVTLAYSGATHPIRDVLGRDAFIDALSNPPLVYKVR